MMPKETYVILLGSGGAKGFQVSIDESAEEKKLSTLVLTDVQRFLMEKGIPYYVDYPHPASLGCIIECILKKQKFRKIIVLCSSSHVCDIKACVSDQQSVEIWSFDGNLHRNPSIIPRHLHFPNVYPRQDFLTHNGINHLFEEIEQEAVLRGSNSFCYWHGTV